MKKLTEKEKFEAGKAQMYQYLDSQYLAWHIVAVESIKKLILNLDDFYSDITGENQPLSIVEHEQIKNEVRIGWIFEALSHAEQAIEDLFSFLMLSKNIDTFVKNVVNYNATDVKRYIWNFKTNDPSKFLGEFFLPYFDLDDSLTWADHQDCYIEYRIAVLRMQTYLTDLVSFHKEHYQDYCQYKHGLAVGLRYGRYRNGETLTKGVLQIKDKYGIVRNNQVAILCRSNSTAFKVGENLSTPYKIFEETVLDRDNSEWGRFFRDLLSASFDESVFAVDYAEQLFSEELEPQKYRKALALCQSIFSNSFDDFCNAEDKIKELAGLVYAQKETKVALNNLHSVIRDPHQLKNYVPARENELNIMTLHKSKGLEFNIVFHMDMYKWIIPNEFGDESSVQQDLNLHYVGLTRAKDACYIMNGTARFRSKKNDYIFAEPSLFLSKPGLAERRKDVRWEM